MQDLLLWLKGTYLRFSARQYEVMPDITISLPMMVIERDDVDRLCNANVTVLLRLELPKGKIDPKIGLRAVETQCRKSADATLTAFPESELTYKVFSDDESPNVVYVEFSSKGREVATDDALDLIRECGDLYPKMHGDRTADGCVVHVVEKQTHFHGLDTKECLALAEQLTSTKTKRYAGLYVYGGVPKLSLTPMITALEDSSNFETFQMNLALQTISDLSVDLSKEFGEPLMCPIYLTDTPDTLSFSFAINRRATGEEQAAVELFVEERLRNTVAFPIEHRRDLNVVEWTILGERRA